MTPALAVSDSKASGAAASEPSAPDSAAPDSAAAGLTAPSPLRLLRPSADDAAPTTRQLAAVEALLGRPPQCRFQVVVTHCDSTPVVIANAPLLDDGTPMPTRYWLVDAELRRQVSRLEGDGGVRAAEAAVDPEVLAGAHDRYAAERDALVPQDHRGPRPTGGVGGTARGVKCLHAHLAYRLADGDDPVGDWVLAQLGDISMSPTVESAAVAPALGESAAAAGSDELCSARTSPPGAPTPRLTRRGGF